MAQQISEARTFELAPGESLTVVADLQSAGTVWRSADSAGGAGQGQTAVAAGETKTLGPYNTPTRFNVVPSAGFLTVTQGLAAVPVPLVKATGAEIDTGTDDAKFTTPKGIADSSL